MAKKIKAPKSLQLGKKLVFSIPTLWLVFFFLVPFSLVLKISFSSAAISIPPYLPLIDYLDSTLSFVINLSNYQLIFDDQLYLSAYLGSLKLAGISTIFCLLLGYPMAYAIAKAPPKMQVIFLLLIMLPSWTSFLIRIYAWIGLLNNKGLINHFLLSIGVIDQPLQMMNTNFAVIIGIVYAYLPFAILPLYANLVKLDFSLIEAASDLGSRKINTFWTITLPLSINGIIAGAMLVFIPAVGEFVIPELLGGPNTLMIGKVLWQEFFNNRDWPVASALAILMLMILIIPIVLFHRYQSRELEKNAS